MLAFVLRRSALAVEGVGGGEDTEGGGWGGGCVTACAIVGVPGSGGVAGRGDMGRGPGWWGGAE